MKAYILILVFFLSACASSSVHESRAVVPIKAYVSDAFSQARFRDPKFMAEFSRLTRSLILVEFLDAGDSSSHPPSTALEQLPIPRGPKGERVPDGEVLAVDLIDPSGKVVDVWCIQATSPLHAESVIAYDKSIGWKPGSYHSKPAYFLSVTYFSFPFEEEPNKPLVPTTTAVTPAADAPVAPAAVAAHL